NDTLLAYGLDGGEDALDIAVRGGPGVGGQAVRDRQAIGFIATVFPPASAFSETAASMPIRLLPIDDAAYAKMQELNPGYGRGVIPGGIYPGVDEDVPTVTDDTVLLAPANLPEEHGYWIARTLAENAEKLTKLGPPFKNFSPKMMPKVMVLDLHPGAKRYYQEAGLLP
ncbi:MAG: TAXI family TRAP transporter solute-binding subunit, partial [Alphaproteobacteria bacterium]